MTRLEHFTQPWPVPQHYPPAAPSPYIPPPPRGRWIWIPDYGPQYPTPYAPDYGCPACANGGVCTCVRPGREVTCDTVTVALYSSSTVAHVGQH